jgi:membrane protease YdiL (CAAX protease family)
MIAYFSNHELTKGLKKKSIEKFVKLLKLENYNQGDIIVEEGKEYESIRFLFHGEVDVLRTDGGDHKQYALTQLGPGATFGEMAFINAGASSATVQAKQSCTVFELSRSAIVDTKLYQIILQNIALMQITRLKGANDRYIHSMQETIEKQREQNNFGRFYITTILLFGITSFIPNTNDSSPAVQLWNSWLFLFAILAPIVYLVRKQGSPVSSFGLTTKNAFKSALDALIVAIVMAPFAILAKIMMSETTEPLFTWKTMQDYTRGQFVLYLLTYIPHSAIQEFMTRGAIQGALHKFMSESHFMVPILITSSLFAVVHMHISLQFALLTFTISIIFGYVYYRQQSIIGTTILHYCLGVLAMSLGLL